MHNPYIETGGEGGKSFAKKCVNRPACVFHAKSMFGFVTLYLAMPPRRSSSGMIPKDPAVSVNIGRGRHTARIKNLQYLQPADIIWMAKEDEQYIQSIFLACVAFREHGAPGLVKRDVDRKSKAM